MGSFTLDWQQRHQAWVCAKGRVTKWAPAGVSSVGGLPSYNCISRKSSCEEEGENTETRAIPPSLKSQESRVQAAPWNYSILVLAVLVVMTSMFLLRRSILANRNRKKQPQDKETPEDLHLDDSIMKENNSQVFLRETLISEKPDLAPGEPELKEKDSSLVFLPDPQETES